MPKAISKCEAKWVDVFGNYRKDCIHCGKDSQQGNSCITCWNKLGGKPRWYNTDIGRFNNLLEIMIVP